MTTHLSAGAIVQFAAITGTVFAIGLTAFGGVYFGDRLLTVPATSGPPHLYSTGSYGFSNPDSIAADGTDIWVANLDGGADSSGSVTELNADNGHRMLTLSGPSYGFNGPWAIAVDGHPCLGRQPWRQFGDGISDRMTASAENLVPSSDQHG